MTRIGENVLTVDNTLRPHMEKMNPGGMVYFQNDINEALWAKARFPKSNIVIRYWPDAETYRKWPDVTQWVAARSNLIGTGIILQTMNEGGFNPEIIAWHERLLTYLINSGIDLRVGLLGLNVGTPKPEEWPMADNMFRLMAKLRGRAFLILHEYFGSVVTSGFIGGNPNNAGVAPGQPGGTNLIPFNAWPNNPQAMTMWHVGRYKFLEHHLNLVGIPVPQIIIGEFGADYLSDIDGWLRSLHSTQGQYDVVDGWRDLWNDWRGWWNIDPADAYMRQIAYADQKIYDENIVAIILYGRGATPDWRQYRTDPDMDTRLESYSGVVLPPPVVIPPVIIVNPPPVPVVVDNAPRLKKAIQDTLDSFK